MRTTASVFIYSAHCSCIDVPIIPEVIPIQLKDSLRQIAKLKKLDHRKFGSIKGNAEDIRNPGVQQAITLIRKLFNIKVAYGILFYTLN